MFNRLIILALLFLASEKVNSLPFPGFLMTFSDALPVQLWPVACATYNEHEASGMFHKCFCAPWECDDVIKIQFEDTPGQIFSLVIFDSNDSELGSFDIEEVESGIYEYALNLAEDSPDVCDQQIQLKIRREQGEEVIEIPALTDWDTTTLSGNADWTTGAAPTVTVNGSVFPGVFSEYLFAPLTLIEGQEYTININYTKVVNIPAQNPRTIIFTLHDASFTILYTDTVPTPTSGELAGDPGPRTATFVFTAPADVTQIAIRVNEGSNVTYTINEITGSRATGSPDIVAKSDCLDIRVEHPESILISYFNHRNFAGLKYEISSPEIVFYIRVPAVFYHQRFPEEDEVMELSSSLVTLNGTLRKQRQLEIDYVPYYFHEKLKLILKHQFITILDRQWVKQEGYEIVEGERRWPVKKGKVWLSEKDFVHRNIL